METTTFASRNYCIEYSDILNLSSFLDGSNDLRLKLETVLNPFAVGSWGGAYL